MLIKRHLIYVIILYTMYTCLQILQDTVIISHKLTHTGSLALCRIGSTNKNGLRLYWIMALNFVSLYHTCL